MKKYLILGFLPAVAIAFLFATGNVVTAEEGRNTVRGGIKFETTGQKTRLIEGAEIDAKMRADIETAIKAEKSRCESLSAEEQKKICLGQLESRIKTKFSNVRDDNPFFLEIFRPGESDTRRMNEKAEDRMRLSGDDDKKTVEERGKNFLENFSKRFEQVLVNLKAVHARLEKLAKRIDSRIEKVKENGGDVSASAKYMTAARENLDLSLKAIGSAEASYKNEFGGITAGNATITNYKNIFAETIKHIQEAKSYLKTAHGNMVKAITSLKPSAEKVKASAGTKIEIESERN